MSLLRFARGTLLALVVGAVMVGCWVILVNLVVNGDPRTIVLGTYGAALGAFGAVWLFRMKCPKCSRRIGGLRLARMAMPWGPMSAMHSCPHCRASFHEPFRP
jgi:hypothetical protein